MSNGTKWTEDDLIRFARKKAKKKPAKQMTTPEFAEWNRNRFSKKHTTIKDEKKYLTARIEYNGEFLGLNQYKTMHWRKMKPIYDRIKANFTQEIEEMAPPPMNWFEVRVFHNTRYDVDNLAGMVKPFVDALRGLGVVPEDDKRYWDYMSIQHAPQIEKGSIVFEVKGEKKE